MPGSLSVRALKRRERRAPSVRRSRHLLARDSIGKAFRSSLFANPMAYLNVCTVSICSITQPESTLRI